MIHILPLPQIGCFELSDKNHCYTYQCGLRAVATRYGYATQMLHVDSDIAPDFPMEWLYDLPEHEMTINPAVALEEYLWSVSFHTNQVVPMVEIEATLSCVKGYEEGEDWYQIALVGQRYVVTCLLNNCQAVYPKLIRGSEYEHLGWWEEAYALWSMMRGYQKIVEGLHSSLLEDKSWILGYLQAHKGDGGQDLQRLAETYQETYGTTGLLSWKDYQTTNGFWHETELMV